MSADTTDARQTQSQPHSQQKQHLVGETLEVDTTDDDDDLDSALGEDDSESVVTSLTSSATDFKYEFGRRYHAYKDGQYHLPNDEREIGRLELQHRIWYITLNGRLHLAPLPEPEDPLHPLEVIDVGCGTGSWAIDFATAYPQSRVTGTDLSPIQPSNVPNNCNFIVDDATERWAFGQKFDYVHARMLGIVIREWDKFFAQCFENLKPGGWIETQEWSAPFISDDESLPPDCAFTRWNDGSAGRAAGFDVTAPRRFPQYLSAAGFTNVTTVLSKWPLGPWPKGRKEKRIGALFLEDMLEALPSATLRLYTRVLGWSEESVHEFMEEVRKDMTNPNYHAYMPVHICYAQKPFE